MADKIAAGDDTPNLLRLREKERAMPGTKLIHRDEIDQKYKWNARSVFATSEELDSEFQAIPPLLEDIKNLQGRLKEGPHMVLQALDKTEEIVERAGRVHMYTYIAFNINTLDQEASKAHSRGQALYGQALAATSFIQPEVLEIGRTNLDCWMEEEPRLQIFAHYFENLFRRQTHVLSPELEELLGMVEDPFSGAESTFSSLVDADLRFEPARTADGDEIPVATNTLGQILSGADREARRSAWENYNDAFLSHQNTLASNLTTSLRQFIFRTRARKHASSLQAALHQHNIPQEVFHNLLDVFKQNLGVWQRYFGIRRKALQVETLHPYDIWAPLTNEQPEIPYEQALELILEGIRPLGEEYVETLRRGCLEEGWVDVYPTRGKTGGAFSYGWKGTYPFIKLNYDSSLFGLSTLAHELGHSIHSYLTWQNQPVVYSIYSLFAAEVASNFHQAMVRAYLLKNSSKEAFQINVIEEAMSNFHRYFFIMPTLARFELEVHQRLERGQGLSAEDMNELMADLFSEGYGSDVRVGRDRVGITWATFGHLYVDYYAFQYATGISGAHALAKRILIGEPGAVEDYLGFLKAGSSRYPLDALKDAGVDLTQPAPVEAAFSIMEGYIDRLEKLTLQ
jgi:oligoendopeptidase F